MREMQQLREEDLIKRSLLFFLLPMVVIGLLGCRFPYVYAVLPVHETDMCICSFFETMYYDDKSYLLLKTDQSFAVIQTLNIITFLVSNWLFLVVLLWMIFKIRHIEDETLIKWESVCLISTWTIFSFLQYVLFLIS